MPPMRPGLKASLILHGSIFLVLFFGLPVFNPDRSYEAQVVTVEILPISELTNVKPKQAKPKEQPKKEAITKNAPKISRPEPKQKPEDKVKVEPLKPILTKVENKESVKVKQEDKPKPKPEEKKTEPEKKTKSIASEDDFAAVLKSVEEASKESEKKEKDEKADEDFDNLAQDLLANAKDAQYKEGAPLSISEKDAIRQQITKNWSTSGGGKDAQNMVVTLHINVQPDGTISKAEIVDKSRYNSDPFFRAIADSGLRAVWKSSPLQGLPADKYDVRDGWRELEMNFDLREMMY